jgi:hypothetical protein
MLADAIAQLPRSAVFQAIVHPPPRLPSAQRILPATVRVTLRPNSRGDRTAADASTHFSNDRRHPEAAHAWRPMLPARHALRLPKLVSDHPTGNDRTFAPAAMAPFAMS